MTDAHGGSDAPTGTDAEPAADDGGTGADGTGTDAASDTDAVEEFERVDFELPNVGPGPDRVSLSGLAADHDFVVVLLQRDHYCTNCREQVRTLKERYGEFRDRNAEVVSIVPEPVERVREWQDSYGLPYPLLADPEASVGEAYGQPVRFGVLGNVSDFLGRQPEVVVFDARVDPPRAAYVHRGKTTFDRPSVEDLLGAIDDARGD